LRSPSILPSYNLSLPESPPPHQPVTVPPPEPLEEDEVDEEVEPESQGLPDPSPRLPKSWMLR